MEAWTTLLHLVILLSGALVLGILAEQLRQSAIIGYILGGMVIGPKVLGWVGTGEEVAMMAEIGAALLLFSIGLEFSFRRLSKLGGGTFWAGLGQILVTGLVGFMVSGAAGVEARVGVVIGAMVALSSTACVLRVLGERSQLDSTYGRSALGILLLQDVAVVPLVILVTALTGTGGTGSIFGTMGKTIGLGALMVAGFYLLLNYLIPRLLHLPSITRNRELPIILAAVLAVGSGLTAHKLGMSASFGAFLAGLLLAESPFAHQIRADISSLKTLLLTLFFAAIGMFGDPAWMVGHLAVVGGWLLVTVVVKALVIVGVMTAVGFQVKRAVATGLALAQIGEFSFMLAGIAYGDGLLGDDLFQLLIAITIVSLILTPYMIRLSGWVYHHAGASSGAAISPLVGGMAEAPSGSAVLPAEAIRRPIIIVGFGPAGRRIAETLSRSHAEELMVIDSNPKNAQAALLYKAAFYIGDARHSEVLEHMHVRQAKVVIITVPDHQTACRIIQVSKSLAPATPVAVRCRHHIYWGYLKLAGADVVVDEEEQIGKALAGEIDG